MARENSFTEEWLATVQQRQRRFGWAQEVDVPPPAERHVLKACLEAFSVHSRVALYWRANSGGFKDEHGQYVKMNFEGCSDILFMLKGGRFGACECKRPGEEPSDAQAAFLFDVWEGGGCAFVATNALDVFRNLPKI